jgi:HlyD family secretion protein
MSARVSFLSKPVEAAQLQEKPKTVVPADALTERDGARVVFVLDGDNVRMKTVTLGPAFGDGFELVAGPEPGTKVIKSPPSTLSDGQKVKERTAS